MNDRSIERMRAIAYLGFIGLLSLVPRQAHAQPEVKVDPEFLSLSPIGVDPNTNTMERTITVTNTGTEVLTLRLVGSTCGCVSSIKMDKRIAPGQKGAIRLQVNFKKFVSSAKRQVQRIVLSTNDPRRPYVPINVIIKGKRNRKDVSVEPSEIVIELSREQLRSPRAVGEQIFVLDLWTQRLEITDIETSSNLITSFYDITYRCPNGTETHVFRFQTRLIPVDERTSYEEWLKFSTNHPDFPSVTVPITYHVRSRIRVVPEFLIFNNAAEQDSVKTIRVKSLDKDSKLEIEGVEIRDSWLSLERMRVQPNVVDFKVSLPEVQSGVATNHAQALQTQRTEIVLRLLAPEKIERTIGVLVINR